MSNSTPSLDAAWLDFDAMLALQNRDPEALERWLREQIDALIELAPASYRRRLKGLQFQVDAQRRIHRSPMGRCVELSRMMMNTVQQLREVLGQPSDRQRAEV